MSSSCDSCSVDAGPQPGTPAFARYRKVLWVAFVINLSMFAVEVIAAIHSDSLSLLADSIDFLGDSANYLLSIMVLGASLMWRARAAMLKGIFMLSFGLYIAFKAVLNFQTGIVPEAMTMGIVGSIALAANLSVAAMLFGFRDGDANMQSVWLCTRNDSISNIAVMVAALGVFGTGSGMPDLIVAAIMATLALLASRTVITSASREMKLAKHGAAVQEPMPDQEHSH